jgi:hypothetical protein
MTTKLGYFTQVIARETSKYVLLVFSRHIELVNDKHVGGAFFFLQLRSQLLFNAGIGTG